MNDAEDAPARYRQMAEEVRASGIDGATLARRIGWLLPLLPEEADGEVWRDVQAMRQEKMTNAELVDLILRLALAKTQWRDPIVTAKKDRNTNCRRR